MIANLIELQVNELLNWEFGAALSFLLLAVTLVVFFVWSRFTAFEQLHGGGVQAVVAGEYRVTRNPLQRFTTYLPPQWRLLTSGVEGNCYFSAKAPGGRLGSHRRLATFTTFQGSLQQFP